MDVADLCRRFNEAKKNLNPFEDTEPVLSARCTTIAVTTILSHKDPLKALALISLVREVSGSVIIAYLEGMVGSGDLSTVEIELLEAWDKKSRKQYLELVKKILEYGPELLDPALFTTSG